MTALRLGRPRGTAGEALRGLPRPRGPVMCAITLAVQRPSKVRHSREEAYMNAQRVVRCWRASVNGAFCSAGKGVLAEGEPERAQCLLPPG